MRNSRIFDSLGLPSRPPPVAPAPRNPHPKLGEFWRSTGGLRQRVLPRRMVSALFQDGRVQIHVRPGKIPLPDAHKPNFVRLRGRISAHPPEKDRRPGKNRFW